MKWENGGENVVIITEMLVIVVTIIGKLWGQEILAQLFLVAQMQWLILTLFPLPSPPQCSVNNLRKKMGVFWNIYRWNDIMPGVCFANEKSSCEAI